MSITESELKLYAAASRPTDDESTSGGAIDTSCVLSITQPAAADQLRARSSNGGDTMELTITFRNAAGEITEETKNLTGTSNVTFDGTAERILSVSLASAPSGNVTIERNTAPNAEVVVIPIGKQKASILFIDSASDTDPTVRYEKVFWKNEHGSLSLTNATIELTADPSSSIKIGVEESLNGTDTVEDRLTAPDGISFVDDSVLVGVPDDVLPAGDAIGVWIEMSRGAAAAALKSTFTTRLAGTST